MPLPTNQFFNAATQSWATSLTLWPTWQKRKIDIVTSNQFWSCYPTREHVEPLTLISCDDCYHLLCHRDLSTWGAPLICPTPVSHCYDFLVTAKKGQKKETILLKKHLHNFNITLPNNYFEPRCSVSVHDPNKLSWISMTFLGLEYKIISNSLNFHDQIAIIITGINAVWCKKFQTSPHGNGWHSRMHSCTTGIMPGICDNALKPRNNLILRKSTPHCCTFVVNGLTYIPICDVVGSFLDLPSGISHGLLSELPYCGKVAETIILVN